MFVTGKKSITLKNLFFANSLLLIVFFSATAWAQVPTYDWAYRFGSASGPSPNVEIGVCTATDLSGNIYMTGKFDSIVDFDPGPGVFNLTSGGAEDIYIAKYNSAGNFIWAGRIGGAGDETVTDMAIDGNGNTYITGYFNFSLTDFDPGPGTTYLSSGTCNAIFVAKYDAAGNYKWAFSPNSANNCEYSWSITPDNSGNIYIGGYFTGTTDFDPGTGTANLNSFGGSIDGFIAKYDSSGNYIFADQIGGTGDDGIESITLDPANNIYVTGWFSQTSDFDPGTGTANLVSAGLKDIFVAKYTASGNYLLAFKMGSSGIDQGLSVKADAGGNIYVGGRFRDTADFDPGVGVNNLISAGTYNAFVAQYNSSGNYSWALSLGSSGATEVFNMDLDISGIYITGFFQNTVDFDPGAGTATITSNAGSSDIYAAKYNTSGNYEWAFGIGGTGGDCGYCIKTDASGYIYLTGQFQFTADFDPSGNTANLTSAGYYDSYLGKYDSHTMNIQNYSENGKVDVYPNPFTSIINVMAGETKQSQLEIYNVLGEIVYQSKIQNPKTEIDLSTIPSGVYFITINDGERTVTKKIIKQ